MKTEIKSLPNKVHKITVTVEKEAVDKAFIEALEHLKTSVKIDGFREGMAPLPLIKERLDKGTLNGHVMDHLLPYFYSQAVNEHKLRPITDPKIEIGQFEEGKELIFTATVIEKPDVEMGDYKTSLTSLKSKTAQKPSVDELIKKVLEVTKIEVPKELVETEVTRMISSLIDQTARLGISVDEYLHNQKKTVEDLRLDYSKVAEYNLKAEFVLMEIASKENIQVSDEEIQKTIEAAPDEQSRKALSQEDQKWYIKSILKKNKTIQSLINVAFEP